jgi:hypothetical protein
MIEAIDHPPGRHRAMTADAAAAPDMPAVTTLPSTVIRRAGGLWV